MSNILRNGFDLDVIIALREGINPQSRLLAAVGLPKAMVDLTRTRGNQSINFAQAVLAAMLSWILLFATFDLYQR